jgi:abhydrolase domain-containing protein 12
MQVAGIPPERIVILGQSLGTAVSSAVALHFADPGDALIPERSRGLRAVVATEGAVPKPTTFAGVILVAPFSSLPSLMLTYRIGGLLPILLPLRPFPYLAGLLTSQMVDKWLSAERLEAYYYALARNPALQTSAKTGRNMGTLQLFHSIRDMDIPYHQTEMICRRIFDEGAEPGVYDDESQAKPVECIDGSHGPAVLDITAVGRPRVRFEILEYGGKHDQTTRKLLRRCLTDYSYRP